jgi:hypothetical protein
MSNLQNDWGDPVYGKTLIRESQTMPEDALTVLDPVPEGLFMAVDITTLFSVPGRGGYKVE